MKERGREELQKQSTKRRYTQGPLHGPAGPHRNTQPGETYFTEAGAAPRSLQSNSGEFGEV